MAAPAAAAAAPEVEYATWEEAKAAGNAAFAAGHNTEAVAAYTAALAAPGAPQSGRDAAVLFANRAFARTKLEHLGTALSDADEAIKADGTYAKAFYRRGSACLGLGRTKEALAAFRNACKLEPRSRDARAKLALCQKAVRALAFRAAIEVEDEPNPSEVTVLSSMADPPEDYKGPRLPSGPNPAGVASGTDGPLAASAAVPAASASASAGDGAQADAEAMTTSLAEYHITADFVKELLEWQRQEKKLHAKYAFWIILECLRQFKRQESLVDIELAEGEHVNVCGDTHGQYYDLLNIFELAGNPRAENRFIFNGDFCDRGSFSVEVVLALFAFKALLGDRFTLLRGNHETINMNKMYGFEGEVHAKYSVKMMDLFTEVFCMLPLSACIRSTDDSARVMVVHGGLFEKDGVTLDDIRAIRRNRQPDDGLMCEMLWSDPQPFPGRAPNKRGVGVAFGPDVTKRFCDDNKLEMVVRSHEVKDEGYLVEADGKLVTVFSAPNYVDSAGNKGAYIRFEAKAKEGGDGFTLEPNYFSFAHVPHPPVKPMAYASQFAGLM